MYYIRDRMYISTHTLLSTRTSYLEKVGAWRPPLFSIACKAFSARLVFLPPSALRKKCNAECNRILGLHPNSRLAGETPMNARAPTLSRWIGPIQSRNKLQTYAGY